MISRFIYFIRIHPWLKAFGFICVLCGKNKKSPVFFQDRGLIENINPHNILTPKTVRGHPGRSSGSPTSVRLPSHAVRDQWLEPTEIGPCFSQGRDYSGGSAPDLNGIPFAWM
jgi:hypothetical protein